MSRFTRETNRRSPQSCSARVTRRKLLRAAVAAGAGAIAMPLVLPSRLFGANAPSNRLNVAAVGTGGRCRALMTEILRQGENLVALCDVDQRQLASARQGLAGTVEGGNQILEKATLYDDYRKLLDAEKSLDAVVIAIGSRWHAPISVRAMQAGKHVYCEKPLVRTIAEARELRDLTPRCQVATQMGTQGVSSRAFRRSVEVIQAGVLGPIERVYLWSDYCGKFPPSQDRPAGEDPIPEGLNWDSWLGPCAWRPFKAGVYMPGCIATQNWLDLCNGMLSGQGAHTFQLPVRALKLDAPVRVTAELPEPVKETYVSQGCFRFEYAARDGLAPVTLWWGDGGKYPPAEITDSVKSVRGQLPSTGCLFVGQRGQLYADGWGVAGIMKLEGDQQWRGVLNHEAVQDLPLSVPRLTHDNHMQEWFDACKGGPATYNDFQVSARVSEAYLPGILSLRLGRPIEWDSARMQVPGAPEADRWIQNNYRTKWLT
jgi:hypothetical protein